MTTTTGTVSAEEKHSKSPHPALKFGAPWGKTLKWSSALGILLITVITSGSAAYLRSSHHFDLPWFMHALPLLLLVGTAPFIIRGYSLSPAELRVHRLFWDTRIPLTALRSVEVLPHAMKGSMRLCGNGGLLSYTGHYWSTRLSHYRAFVNDGSRTLVLRFSGAKTIVLSTDQPQALATALEQQITPP
jgi:hypothetical protein